MPKSTICGCFFFKASHAQELVEVKTAQLILVEVVKILQLTGQQFQNFSANLLRDMPFLIPNKHLTGYDSTINSVPAPIRIQPKMDLGVNCSCRMTAARIMVITTLSLSMGITLDASPICRAL